MRPVTFLDITPNRSNNLADGPISSVGGRKMALLGPGRGVDSVGNSQERRLAHTAHTPYDYGVGLQHPVWLDSLGAQVAFIQCADVTVYICQTIWPITPLAFDAKGLICISPLISQPCMPTGYYPSSADT